MSAHSDFNMLHLEVPRKLLQISIDDESCPDSLEVTNPADWMWAIANHQYQAKQDLHKLIEVNCNTVDWTDCQI